MLELADYDLVKDLRKFISKDPGNINAKTVRKWLSNRRLRMVNKQRKLLNILEKEYPQYYIKFQYVPDCPCTIGIHVYGIDNLEDEMFDKIFNLEDEMFEGGKKYDLILFTHSTHSTKTHYKDIWDKMQERLNKWVI